MRRIAIPIALAALLNACGGGSDQAEPQALASNSPPTSASPSASSSSPYRVAAPDGMVDRIDQRLRGSSGPVEVWVSLEQNSIAAQRAELAESSGLATAQGGELAKTMGALREGVSQHKLRINESQANLSSGIAALGGSELARVQVAHNAIAVRIEASQLDQLAALQGVDKVRPVLHYETTLAETVPYVGGTAVQATGRDGAGVKVAVLDSGIDYTHRNLAGPGTAEAYAAAYGANPADPLNTTLDGLFPTAKVIAGYDFVGETWGVVNNVTVGVVVEDPDPIDFEGHGTHVADIIAGQSLDGVHKGMAPGAKLFAVKVCSAISSACNGIALLKGMDFALDPNGDLDTSDAVDIINMSLGSSYGQIQDDLTQAATNAVRIGVVVVASAGNGSNRPYITGSPAIAPGVISVAQTAVPSAQAVPLVVNTPPAIAGIYGNTATVEWAPVGAGVTDDVAFVGRSCPAGSVPGVPGPDPFLSSPAGKIALIDRGGCSISLKVDYAVANGAVGVLIGLVAPGDAVSFSFGGGTNFAPTLVIQQSLSTAIKAQLTAGQTVNASISPAAAIPLVGSMASSSSRGPSVSTSSIKPEIGAPGASLSAEAGTGTGQTPFGGTSGAAPMVAGAAALLVQAFPNRSPERIKAMLMNSAETVVYTNPALLPGELAPITRIGAGELRVDRAINQNAIAWNRATRSAALSFGAVEADSRIVIERTLRVQNFANTERLFTITPSFRYAADEATGAISVEVRSRVRISPRGFEDVDVKLVIDPSKLPTWTLNGGFLGGDGAALNGPEYDGYITLTAGSEKITVPWQVLPRKAASTEATLSDRGRPGPTVRFRNRGAEAGEYEAFSLIGVNGRIPRSELPAPGDNFAIVDLRAVGIRYLPASVCGVECLEFAVHTIGRRAHPNYPAEFRFTLDTTGDGKPDFVVFNRENGGFGVSGQNAVFVGNLTTGTTQGVFFTDADLNSGNVIMTVPTAALGVTTGTTIGLSVRAIDNYFTGATTDEILDMRFTPGIPRFGVVGLPFGSVPTGGVTDVGVTTATLPDTLSSELGLLMMYRRNAGPEANILRIR